jgi:AGCS family alanine or glycine:cation symporter
LEQIQDVIDPVSAVLWGWVLVYVLLGAGVWFTVCSHAVQLRKFLHLFRVAFSSRGGAGKGISSFQAFCVGLASRVGTGNIAGVAIALTLGGPGAIFWMWMVALLGMATAFAEATLAQIFKVPADDGAFRGGPAFYIARGLGSPRWGMIFAVLLIFTFGIAFNAVQSNTIAAVLHDAHTVPSHASAVILVVLAAPVFFGGVRRVARVAEIVLPLMALSYIGLALVIVVLHANQLFATVLVIVQSAFGFGPAAAGATGGVAAAMMNGVKPGLFSNEAGMGSAPNTVATATVAHPALQGFVQALGVFIDTMVACSATALIVLVSGVVDFEHPGLVSGASLSQLGVTQNFGVAGQWFMTAIVFAFAFSSVLGNYFYAEVNLGFLNIGRGSLLALRVAALLAVLTGSVVELPVVWALADIAMGALTLVNVVAIVALSRWVIAALADYEAALAAGREPVFDAAVCSNLPPRRCELVW